jgi:ABC-type transport system involved in multi-copper enzyme maturation permease subunit
MRHEIRSEFRKLRTTRTVWGLLGAVAALTGLGAWGVLAGSEAEFAGASLDGLPVFLVATTVVAALAVVAGVRAYTDEVRYGSIVPTLVSTPDRRRVVAAKVLVIGATAAIFGLVSVGVGAGVSLVWFAVHGIEVTVGAAALAALGAKMMLIGAAWSAIGVGVGLIVGHQVAALVGSLLYVLVIEDLIGAFAGGVAKYLPGGAADAVVGLAPGGMTVLAPATGAMLIAAWVAVSVVAGERRLQGRDIA